MRLPPATADPARLLARKRGHWGIENGLHLVKDTALREDRCLVHLGAGPMVPPRARNPVGGDDDRG